MSGGEQRRRILPRFRLEEDVEREMDAHLGLAEEELIQAGWDPPEARKEAMRRFGDRAALAEECLRISKGVQRAVRREKRLESMMQDVRYGLRALVKSPGFSLVAILTLALGIGATVTVFSLVNGVLLRPLPFDRPEELVWVAERGQSGGQNRVAWANFRDWRTESRSFRGLVAYGEATTTVLGGSEPAFTPVAFVSRDFWTVFPLSPVAGRLTGEGDHREGVAPVAVVSESFAREVLGSVDALGAMVEVFGTRLEVVGVLPGDFDFPSGATVWIPAELERQSESRSSHNWKVVGRLGEGVTAQDAFLELDPMTRRLVATAPEDEAEEYLATGAIVTSLRDRLVGDAGRPLLLLMGAAVFVLLVACTNLASTLLARATTRGREVAVRSALGASRGRILRQLLSEAGLLAGLGGATGLGAALAVLRGIQLTGTESIPRLEVVSIDRTVLFFTLVVAALTALAFGLVPALRTGENAQALTLRSEGRGNEGYRGRIWGSLVATEVALALVLLTGSGLLIRSFSSVVSEEGGFDGTDVALTSVALSGIKYPELEDHRLFWEGMLGRAQAIPGVVAAGLISSLPVSGFVPNGLVHLDGDVSRTGNGIYVVSSEGVFDALDIPLLQGRLFDERDGPDAPHAVVVSRSFADAYWPGESPIGKQVSGGGMDDFWSSDPPVFGTVVGVVGDVRFRDLTRAGRPTVYWNFRQRPYRIQYGANLLVESSSGDPALVAGSLRDAVTREDPDIAVRLRYLRDLVSDSVAERRFVLLIMSGFAISGLFLAALGIYGVVSYAVARRSREMGIRLALGATGGTVSGMVLAGAMGPVILGLIVGLAGAWALSRVLSGFLYDVQPTDPVTFLGVVLLLLMTGWVASWIPARRGTRVDPMITMRAE
ncbi:MAG: ADOP family duplicated permease [Longimicrobiales bacterium]